MWVVHTMYQTIMCKVCRGKVQSIFSLHPPCYTIIISHLTLYFKGMNLAAVAPKPALPCPTGL